MLLLIDSEKELNNKDILDILDHYTEDRGVSEKAQKELLKYYFEKIGEKSLDFDMVRESSTDLFEKSGKLHDNLLEVFSYYFSSNNLEEFFDIVGSFIMESKLKEIEFQQKDNIIKNLEEKNRLQACRIDEENHVIERYNNEVFKLREELKDAEKNEKTQKEGERLRKIFNEIIKNIGWVSYNTIDKYLETSAIEDFEEDLEKSLEYYESRLASQDKSKLGYLKARNEIRDLLKDPFLANDYMFLKSVQTYINDLIIELTKSAALSEANQKVFEVAEKWEKAMANGGKDVVASSGNKDEYVENLLNGVQDLVEQYKEDLQNER